MLALLTLNVSRPPKDRARGILEYLWSREESILVLTETAPGGGSSLIAAVCRAAGYAVHSSLAPPAAARPGRAGRPDLGVLVIGRGIALRPAADVPEPSLLPERLTAVDLLPDAAPGASAGSAEPVRLIAAYGAASDPLRYASATQRQRKRDWLDAFLDVLSRTPARPTLVAGDLNIVAPGHSDRLPYVLAEERTAYERITGELGYHDAYADHGGGDPSWVDHSGAGCRYDYVLTQGLGTGHVALDQTPRLAGLSDHAALSWQRAPTPPAVRAD